MPGANGTFAAAVNYTAADGPRGLDLGDLDGDGYPDIVTANRDAGNITVLLNDGDGTFAAPVTYTAGTGPTDVICRDLDGDCDVDVVVANLDSDDVTVLEGKLDGTLATGVSYGAGDGALKLANGDLDDDKRPDVIVIGAWVNDVSVIMNNSLGIALASAGPDSGYSIPFVEPTAYALNDDASTPTILLAVVVGVAPLMLMLGAPRVRRMASAIGAIAIGWLRTAQQRKDSRERDLGRRQHSRWNWSATIEIRRLGQDHTWSMRAVNVSLGGMTVVSPESLTVDEVVELKTDKDAHT